MEKDILEQTLVLPPPLIKGSISLEEVIASRRSRREISDQAISLEALSQILWSAQGITERDGQRRSVPSAGCTYPLEVFVLIGGFGVAGMAAGLYAYVPVGHLLAPLRNGDIRQSLSNEALGQRAIAEAPITLVLAADFERTRGRYRGRADRYVYMEAGHAAQNVQLQAEALGLGAVPIGAFDDNAIGSVLNLASNYSPLYLIPIGACN